VKLFLNTFDYTQPTDTERAVSLVAVNQNASFIAGGTTLLDLMKLNVQSPLSLVSINDLGLNRIEKHLSGALKIGAMVRMSDAAVDPLIVNSFPVISEALVASASPQLRNMASIGGNLMQRTRCYYFRDTSFACNKREPGSGCPAIDGYNRMHAVLGTSNKCIATHASDLCVALAALDATIRVKGKRGAERTIPLNEFYLEPGDTPEKENVLEHGELITAVDVPHLSYSKKSHYLKVRDRSSYEFALVSVASAIDIKSNSIKSARIALGGVATKPWRAYEAEQSLSGKTPIEESFRSAAEIALRNAKPSVDNAFKVELAKRAIVKALTTVSQRSE
jgi:xanthine dehydrogenase YagS FAD-binding subunit